MNQMWNDVYSTLSSWQPPSDVQGARRDEYLEFLTAHADGVWRECRVGHVTASALVMDEQRQRVLLTLHPKVGRWLQLGGHIEPGDSSLRAAALRESIEESGIDSMRISAVPVCLDRHPVPCAGALSEHLDVQYLALVPKGAQAVMSAESDDLRWFAISELPPELDQSVRTLLELSLTQVSFDQPAS
ncbi:MAG: NUDIX domain-containing protein [Candidatus Nanopelagicales bacterium]|nr:NUDIX domain-containing protein [Candidatus Nanopelagicales bacterium]